MIKLYKTKAYDLRNLNDEQLTELLEWLRKEEPNESWDQLLDTSIFLYYNTEWFESFASEDIDKEIVNALDLFLKIGDTFEYNGYICEVKKPIKRWVYDTYLNSYYKVETINSEYYKEITNQTLIKLLEENAIH